MDHVSNALIILNPKKTVLYANKTRVNQMNTFIGGELVWHAQMDGSQMHQVWDAKRVKLLLQLSNHLFKMTYHPYKNQFKNGKNGNQK